MMLIFTFRVGNLLRQSFSSAVFFFEVHKLHKSIALTLASGCPSPGKNLWNDVPSGPRRGPPFGP